MPSLPPLPHGFDPSRLDGRADPLRDAAEEMRIARERADELAALLATDALTPDMLLELARVRLGDLDLQVQHLMGVMHAATAEAQRIGERIVALRDVMTTFEPLYDREGRLNPDAPMPGRGTEQTYEAALDELVDSGVITPEVRDLLRDGSNMEIVDATRADPLVRDAVRAAQAALAPLGFHGPDGFRRDHVRVVPVTVRDHLYALVADGTLTGDEANAVLTGREGLQTLIDRANDELRQVNSGSEMNMIKLQSVMQQRTSIISATTNLLKSMDEGNDAVIANLR